MKNILLILLLSGMLTACGSTPTKTTSYVTVSIPSTLTDACEVPEPPDMVSYETFACTERETLLTNYSISLLSAITKCNIRLRKIKDINEKVNNNASQATKE